MADKVRFGKGVTINLGNYESVRLDLSLEVEVKPGEQWTDAQERAQGFVEHQLEKEEKIIRGGRR